MCFVLTTPIQKKELIMQVTCCKVPELKPIKVLLERRGGSDTRSLLRCKFCRNYWLQDECEYSMGFDGEDQWRTEYRILTSEEAMKELEAPFSAVKGWMV